jgi:hypothetical protein
MNKTQTELMPYVKLRVLAISKLDPNKTIEKIMTFQEWKDLKKKRNLII